MGLSNYIPSSRIAQSGVCTSTTRPATPFEGQMIYETDTNRVLVYDNTAWVMIADTDAPPGLQKITPTSVSGTGVSVASNGDVVISSGGTNFTVNGCFTSEFANYKIIVRNFQISSGATALYAALGTSNTGTSHKFAGVYVSTSNTVTGLSNASASRFELPVVARGAGSSTGCEFTLIGPQLAQETTFLASGIDSDNGALFRTYGGQHTGDTSFTSLYFSTNTSETISSCAISIYGYRD